MTNYQAKLYSTEGQAHVGKKVHTFTTKRCNGEVYYNPKTNTVATYLMFRKTPAMLALTVGALVVGTILKCLPFQETKELGSEFMDFKRHFKKFITIKEGSRVMNLRGERTIESYSQKVEKEFKEMHSKQKLV